MKEVQAAAPEGVRSRLDPEPVARRDFLGLAAKTSAAAALGFGLLGVLRLPKAAVLPTPTKKFRVVLPESLSPNTPYVPLGRPIVLFRDRDGVYAISAVCTHLGCIVKPTDHGFDCPCHGSKFRLDGSVVSGPAPKPLPWIAVSDAGGGAVMVDEGEQVAAGTKVIV